MANIAGHSMLWHIVQRVREAKLVDVVVVATSDGALDDPIEALCKDESVTCFRGSEDDVLDRFYRAATFVGADAVVRITGDCPLIDATVIDRVVARYLEGGHDYVSNTIRYTYPDGLDVEVVAFGALERAWREADTPVQREHVTPFVRFGDAFTKLNVESETDLSSFEYRWTVDEPADLDFVREVYRHLYHEGARLFGLDDVLRLLRENPEMTSGNRGIVSNEGAYKTIAQDPPVPVRPRKLTRSAELAIATERLIPSSSQTFSKGPTQYVQGVAPAFLARGRGSHVWDVDGNEYIDCPMALGAVILGHNYPSVSEAVILQMQDGVVFSLPHALEFEVAEKLVELIPSAEMVRFAKNGSDATAGAVRAARAYTNRDVIACNGYHGWQDWFIGTTTRNAGVPKSVQDLTVTFEYNDIASLEKVFAEHPGQVAAVIMEPVGVVEPKDDFLKKVRVLADREGALLIFDEIITGFRYAIGGAQELYDVMPDLTCCGKAMANGYPLSAVVGRRDVMEIFDEIFFSFTFGGETISLAAAKATMVEMQEKEVIGHLWSVGRRLRDGFNVLAGEFDVAGHISCVGLGPRTSTSFKDSSGQVSLELKSLFQQECLKRGVLFSGGHNMCFSHTDADVEEALHVYRTAMEICAIALKEGDIVGRLEGPQVQPVFRQA
jgi:glutamate-1-semialdehyde 2,1-aminomutase/spore coat polysaccharide biosynthesis protein SpsF